LRTSTGVIGLLGTDATIRQAYIDRLEERYAKDQTLIRYGAPELVSAAEAKLRGEDVEMHIFDSAIKGLTQQEHGDKIDNIILGCTHFPLLINELTQVLEQKIKFLHGADGIARQIQRLLIENGTPPASSGTANHHFITTGDLEALTPYTENLQQMGFVNFSSI